jgi:diguanylate cyclase (GGDEF)-like protein
MAVALKILLLEDSAIDAELAAYELAKLGMAVEWNRVSTEEALRQALLEFCPSVILSDHSMPAFDRLSALHIASEMTPEIPFIFLSGTIGEEMAIEALKGGHQLTGLPNRSLLNDRAVQAMAYARRERQEMALMLVSIDQLEVVNEGYGRMAAEQAVVEIAKRLGSVSRQGDTVARIVEDSFAVLATDIPRTETVLTRARALNAALRTSIRVLDTDVRMTVSVGMSVFPRDADDWE